MKARLVTHDGCEKFLEVSEDKYGQTALACYRTEYLPKFTYNPEFITLQDAQALEARTKSYKFAGYDHLITSSQGSYEIRAVYWEE